MSTVKLLKIKINEEAVLKGIDELISINPLKPVFVYDERDITGTLETAYEDIHYPVEFKHLFE